MQELLEPTNRVRPAKQSNKLPRASPPWFQPLWGFMPKLTNRSRRLGLLRPRWGRDVLALSNLQHARPGWWHHGSFQCTIVKSHCHKPSRNMGIVKVNIDAWFQDQVLCFAQQLPADGSYWIVFLLRQGQYSRCQRFCKCTSQEAAEDIAWVGWTCI